MVKNIAVALSHPADLWFDGWPYNAVVCCFWIKC